MIRKPDFICIGTQKAGTTSLHDILIQHPDIFLSDRKENHFFDWDERYEKGVEWWLNEFYSEIKNEKVVGAFTPDYIYFPSAAERMAKTYENEDLKLIIILRHPADRAYSHYLMSKGRGYDNLSFEEAINSEAERIQQGFFEKDNFSYLDRGHYLEQINRFLTFVHKEKILFLNFEKDIRQNLEGTLERIQLFIGVEPIPLNAETHSNKARGAHSKTLQRLVRGDYFMKRLFIRIFGRKMMHRLKAKAIEVNESKAPEKTKLTAEERTNIFNLHFKDELDELMDLTGLDLNHWKE